MREHPYIDIAQDPLICQFTALLLEVQMGSNLRNSLLIFKECSLMVRDDSCFLGGWVKDQDVYHTITVANSHELQEPPMVSGQTLMQHVMVNFRF